MVPARAFLEDHNARLRAAYQSLPSLIKEHRGIEQTVLAGGYSYRQVMELVQNGADAILEASPQDDPAFAASRIYVLLNRSRLYVANTGAPLSTDGLESMLSSHSSPKRGNQIGRFGLGFKSLIRIGGRIDLFSQSCGALRFDPERCRGELQRDFGVDDAPGLRLAWPLDEHERSSDDVLERFDWAETIVRVDLEEPTIYDHLLKEVLGFPAEFLLFFPVPIVVELDAVDRGRRSLSIEPDGGDQLLNDGGELSRWRVAKRDVKIIDKRATDDATHIHARESVPVAWAFPLSGKKEEAGRFWAFFPTHTPTCLAGILNAPWKLNSDRNAIIGGAWNSALMEEAAQLIADTLPSLSTVEDPARPLDAFPRQLERSDDDAKPLVEALWTALEQLSTIPDLTGTLQSARHLWRHPTEEAVLLTLWTSLAPMGSLSLFTHAACLQKHRGSRLNELERRLRARDALVTASPNLRVRDTPSWFSEVASPTLSTVAHVLKLAEAYSVRCRPEEWNLIRQNLAIIPSQSGKLMRAEQLVLAPSGVMVPGKDTVDPTLCEEAETRRILVDVMKVRVLDDAVWTTALDDSLKAANSTKEDKDSKWQGFWQLLRLVPPGVREQFIARNRGSIRIRTRGGDWAWCNRVLLPGKLVSEEDSSQDKQFLIDDTVHGFDGDSLASLGVCDWPRGDVRLKDDSPVFSHGGLLREWAEARRKDYRSVHVNSASWDYLFPLGLTLPAAYWFLARLTGTPNAKLTAQFAERIAKGEFAQTVKFGHCTVASYPKIDVRHPIAWLLIRFGRVQVGSKTVALSAVWARRHEPALAALPGWDAVSAVFRVTEPAEIPPIIIDVIRDMWVTLVEVLPTPSSLADDSLNNLWVGAAKDGIVPASLRGESGTVPLSDVFVTGSLDLARWARKHISIVITLDDAASKLWESQGARNLSEFVKPEWKGTTGPAEHVVAAVPELAEVLRSEARRSACCQSVIDLQLKVGVNSQPVPCLMWGGVLFLDTGQLLKHPRTDRLRLLLGEIAGAGWLNSSPGEALQRLGDAGVDKLRSDVAQCPTIAERLLRAVGSRRDPLLHALGRLQELEFIKHCSLQQLAELTLAHCGPTVLSTLGPTLEQEGLKPPQRWNTPESRSFVASIGFPQLFAGAPETRRECEEFVSGPIDLPQLHDFQQEVFEGIQALIHGGSPRRRAVVSLPTGGGKTRVTVEAAVRLVLAPAGKRRTVLWVAQSDELCEQSVQAFRQVWINLGAQGTDLRIIRLWGGNPNPAIQDFEKPLVVVASIQTLNSRIGTNGLKWLSKSGLVVIDECHHAITPSYSNLLRWLGTEATTSRANNSDDVPLVGLSATPFRTDSEESQRLAKRFNNRWLPADQEMLYARLTLQGVLAQPEYQVLESGAGLLPEEIARLAELSEPWEGLGFENIIEAINQRLATDTQRSERLVNHIRRATERSILLFANSVLHAEELAARLNLDGVPAAAVSGNTPTITRRHFLDCFQQGKLRVLCNHSILSAGFDAPKTDMVLIARQVFSPVRYMQMVGRGLRGVKNGGTDRCRIVTVIDNLDRFQVRHPYHYCKSYFADWTREEGIAGTIA